MQRVLSTVTLVGLLVATAAAFAITEHLKLEKSPITGPQVTRYFSPVCGCATARARVSIKFRSATVVTVSIVDVHGRSVATLASEQSVSRGRRSWTWDGRSASGVRAPDGVYRPEIALPHKTYLLGVPEATWILAAGLVALGGGLAAYGVRAWLQAPRAQPGRA